MDFRQLNYFVAVAQELSFSGAAKKLHISQPPLSQQIKLLEEDLGVQLFERTRRVVKLTHAGALFLERATEILAQYAHARALCAWTKDGQAGMLRIAFTASVPMFDAFPHILQGFRGRYPRIELALRHLSTGEQLQALSSGDIDVGFLRPSSSFKAPPTLETTDLWRDELVLAVAQHHPLASATRRIRLEQLAREDFILFPQASGCGLFEHITTLTAQAGFTPTIVQEVQENSTTLALVAAGLGVSIVPSIYSQTKPPGVVFKRLQGDATSSRIVMAASTAHRLVNMSLPHFLRHVQAARQNPRHSNKPS
ncbi:LysR family transcriptional regulator [Allopusillimonas soli]|uniref:LysR family transcriptional regulator n=1 Tax=Allopusillimonas soli TaxID=659016 RepID=A0A853FH67_9BURK|nr:LysR family transcriptional regulator [Allopusillimonas soli]NYT38982.1 LysR family transcriptional regulator [Allopusillimonas soli]TEA69574.1 LysR family transcriptional regulator [Allopusillimonas soli]